MRNRLKAVAATETRPALQRAVAWLCATRSALERPLQAAQDLALLAARLDVAWVFWRSGLTKIQDWSTTQLLFTEEYRVPLLPPELAAWLGTGGELLLPVLLAFGVAGRLGALGLSVVNVVAVLSLSTIAPAAQEQHLRWGLQLMVLLLWGSGRYAVDALLCQRLGLKLAPR
ncbi:DoxX family protein [Roseateles sp. BYS180W]|uniref:DoxX family protein n=1 Tax=Roseateles rivi TaxID=3299028 RepID=A0ABW7FXY3_9BURK